MRLKKIKDMKECMIKWAKPFGYNIQMDQRENMLLKGLKFILRSSFREIFL